MGGAAARPSMPTKSGLSHGLAALGSLVVGSTLAEVVWSVAPSVGRLSLFAVRLLRATTGVALPGGERFAGAVVVMAALAFCWGVLYHFTRHA